MKRGERLPADSPVSVLMSDIVVPVAVERGFVKCTPRNPHNGVSFLGVACVELYDDSR